MGDTAKLFMHGRSQAVRLPKAFRMPGKEVRIRREGQKVILEPVEPPAADLDAWFARLDEVFGDDFMPKGREQPPMQGRDWVDD